MRFTSELAPSQNFDAIIDPLEKLAVEDKLSQVVFLFMECGSIFIKEMTTYFLKKKRDLWLLMKNLKIYKKRWVCSVLFYLHMITIIAFLVVVNIHESYYTIIIFQ
uniref:Uncharacterized protein n=1 Tax=Heterorhabditis bacteriophora TaxID=37862 RepID=A0A1I7X6C9_HETBA